MNMLNLKLDSAGQWCRLDSVSYQVFARKYRPLTFDDILGQDHVVRTLRNAIEQNRLAHAYLFVGPRGTGKTSTARIFAKALNCPGGPKVDFDPHCDICEEIAEGRSLDVLEIDGASNRGIDNIRDLRENVQFAPARGQFRIVYIDEVHMLTKESFNALLKTLEEPPAHVKFIFATTEPHKILPTILSRCQRFDLRPIPAPVIARHLMNIAAKEGVSLSEEAAFGIARVADGGMRDAQSMLDQLVSFCGNSIEETHVNDIFGVTSRETVAQALAYLLDRQLPSLLHMVYNLAEAGRDMGQLLAEIMGAVRELLVLKVAPSEGENSLPERWKGTLSELLERTPADKILRLMEALASTEERMRWTSNKRLHLEMGLIQAVHSLAEANISDIVRALNGAPLPDTPIATTVLPPVSYPAASAEQPARVASVQPPVAPAEQPRQTEQVATLAETSPQDLSLEASEAVVEDEVVAEEQPIETCPQDAEAPIPSVEPDLEVSNGMSAEVWNAVMKDLAEKMPLQSILIDQAQYIDEDEGVCSVALNPADTGGRDALLGDELREVLEELLTNRAGRPMKVKVVFDESVPLPVVPEAEPLPPPRPKPVPPKVPKEPKENKEPVRVEKTEDRKPTDEEFYNDPLIQKALEEFHARIIS